VHRVQPVLGTDGLARAGITICIPRSQVSPDRKSELINAVRAGAAELTHALQGSADLLVAHTLSPEQLSVANDQAGLVGTGQPVRADGPASRTAASRAARTSRAPRRRPGRPVRRSQWRPRSSCPGGGAASLHGSVAVGPRRHGDTKTPRSRRTLGLPAFAATATVPGTRESLFYSPATADPAVVAADEANKDTSSLTVRAAARPLSDVSPRGTRPGPRTLTRWLHQGGATPTAGI